MFKPLPNLGTLVYDPFHMQDALNEFFLTKNVDVFTNHDAVMPGWYEQVNCGNWNYDLCIMEEFGELISCLPLAHYRAQEATPAQANNAIMELVDLQHFVLSKVLFELWFLKIGNYTESHWRVVNPIRKGIWPLYIIPDEVSHNTTKGELKRDLVRSLINTIDPIYGYQEILRQFYRIIAFTAKVLGRAPSEVFTQVQIIYKLKFRLNVFRQLNGAQTGDYRKVVDGAEDNKILLHHYITAAGGTDLSNSNMPVSIEAVWENFVKNWADLTFDTEIPFYGRSRS